MKPFVCRFCGAQLNHRVVDLGMSPLCESYVASEDLDRMEPFYPLHVWVCDRCFLVQLNEYVAAEDIFTEYAYFSSFSSSWLQHAEDYVAMITERLGLGPDSFVVELASNDGYLLQYFVERGIPCLGIEPAANVAASAVERGVPTDVSFFGAEHARKMAAEGHLADLVLGNNVLAQVPRSQRLRRRDPDDSQARRNGDDRVPPPPAAPRGEPVRHHLPRALLLLLPHQRRGHLRRPRHDDLRRRGAVDTRRVTADIRPPRRRHEQAGQRPGHRVAGSARRRPGSARSRPTPGSRSRSEPPSAHSWRCSPESRRTASGSSATAPPARATRC